jgi:hypothetical protein
MEYVNVIQNVLLLIESMLQNAIKCQYAPFLVRKVSELPGFDQSLPVKCSIFPLLFGAEHYQSLETALTNVG